MTKPIFYITGAGGFIGTHLVEWLAKKYSVVAVLRPGSYPKFELNSNIQVAFADLTNRESLLSSMPKRAIVVNLAAEPYNPSLSYAVNVQGTAYLFEVAKVRKSKLFIQISTQATKITKMGTYGETKTLADNLVRESKLTYCILKPSLVYGSGENGLFAKMVRLIKLLPIIPIFGDGRVKIMPLEVQDLAEIIERVALAEDTHNQTFDVGGVDSISYNDLYLAILKIAGVNKPLLHLPVWVGLFGAKLLSWMSNPPLYRDNILGSIQPTNCRPAKLLKLINFAPKSWKEGLAQLAGQNKIKVGIVGLGKMGMLHSAILSTMKDVRIVALIDANKALFTTIKSMGVEGEFFASISEAIGKTKLDAVYIATPTFTHLPLLKEALSYNLNVFLEKPAALNRKQLNEMVKLKPKSVVHVGYTLLYSRTFGYVKQLIDEERFGNLLKYEASFAHSEVLVPKKGWMFDPSKSGGGVLMNPGPHLFAILTDYFGKPTKVSGALKKLYSSKVEDEAHIECEYPGFSGELDLSWSRRGATVPKYLLKMYFEQGQVEVDTEKILIKKLGKRSQTAKYEDLPTPTGVFNLNPRANGEAYYLENIAFLRSIVDRKNKVKNTLDFSRVAEGMIFDVYRFNGEANAKIT